MPVQRPDKAGPNGEEQIFYASIFRDMLDGAYLVRAGDGLILATNKAFDAMFGYRPGELAGKNVSIVNAPALKDPEERAQEIIGELKRKGRWTGEVLNRKKDGTVFWCQAMVTTLNHPRHGLVWLSIHRDITERREAQEKLQTAHQELQASYEEIEAANQELHAAEEELRQQNKELLRSQAALAFSEIRYRRLFEAAKDGILIIDAETGKIEDANPFIVELLGYPAEELLGKELWEIGLFQDIAASREYFLKLRQDGYIRYEDLPLQTKDGDRRDVQFVSNVYVAGDRKVVQCNIRDITERKAVKEALAAAEERFRLAEKAGHIGSWEWDMIGDRLHWSEEIYRIFDKDPRTFTPSNEAVFGAIVPEDRPRARAAVEASVKQQQPFDLEYRIQTGNGEVRWLHSHGRVLNDGQGNPVRAVGIIENITGRKRAEEEVKRQLEELQRWHAAMLDREDRVRELKEEVNALLAAQGRPPKYFEGAGSG